MLSSNIHERTIYSQMEALHQKFIRTDFWISTTPNISYSSSSTSMISFDDLLQALISNTHILLDKYQCLKKFDSKSTLKMVSDQKVDYLCFQTFDHRCSPVINRNRSESYLRKYKKRNMKISFAADVGKQFIKWKNEKKGQLKRMKFLSNGLKQSETSFVNELFQTKPHLDNDIKVDIHSETKHDIDDNCKIYSNFNKIITAAEVKLLNFYHDNYIGNNCEVLFESQASMLRPVMYCDWTASGKPLKCIEEYIMTDVLPLYGNTHTLTSVTGLQSTSFREQAREKIMHSVGGDVEHDVVIFTGTGATGAIFKMSQVLKRRENFNKDTTVVFISIYEHNSNSLIWKEMKCKVIVIPEQKQTSDNEILGIDTDFLEQQLQIYSQMCNSESVFDLLIGSFSAVSNISGIIQDCDRITELLHTYDALSFWDFASGAPYLDIKFSNSENEMLSKDAVFISAHKFLGGPGSPGILCAKKALFTNKVPVIPGGGTVLYSVGIKDSEHKYLEDITAREEGGTPDIIALAFMVKDDISVSLIERVEHSHLKYFFDRCLPLPNFHVNGSTQYHNRLPIISFNISHEMNGVVKLLHHNFVAAVMNDMFGIQGRGGCACAGMYGMFSFKWGEMQTYRVSHAISLLLHNNELAKPGFYRINLHFTMTPKEVQFITDVIEFMCKHCWKLLPLYIFDVKTGSFAFRSMCEKNSLLPHALPIISRGRSKDNFLNYSPTNISLSSNVKIVTGDKVGNSHLTFKEIFAEVENVLNNLDEYLPSKEEIDAEENTNDNDRLFWLPSEIFKSMIKSETKMILH